jgi:surface glycoprotein (TIGR04207 family)
MTERTQKLRAVVLAALMVLSVIAMGTAFVGTAAAGPDDVKSNGYKINVGSDELINESSTQDLEVPEGSINDLTFVIDDQLSLGEGDGEFAFELTFQDDLSLSDTSDVVDIEIVNDVRGDTEVLTSSVVDNVALVNFTSGSLGNDDELIVKFTVTDVQATTGPVSSDDDITTNGLDGAGSGSVGLTSSSRARRARPQTAMATSCRPT